MGKQELETMPAEQEEADIITARRDWYRRLLQAIAFSRRRLGYLRLPKSSSKGSTRKRSSRIRVARLGNRPRPVFRLRTAASRLRWRWLSPLSLLAKLRDAYVNLMLSASAKLTSSSEGLAFGVPYPSHPFLYSASSGHHYPSELVKHHDKLLMDLYMAMAQHQFLCPTPSSC
ncbi:hypothetical protein GOP47_0007674 [Adiantum capillus-veneris]|uniref:Uncharacterized protein n=1 Tax=Adiantum capillus-veneris TaxID=13818 RepID=A0A9D4V159_ADICA|nr:hypothetical protein GOP47_0007674 [Adiantum capillus-veneris]